MKISELYSSERHESGAEMQIFDESGEPTNLYVSFVGVDSKKYRDIQGEIERKTVEWMRDPEKTKRMDDETFYAKCALGWRGDFEDDDGKPLEFKEESIKNIFYQAPYIFNQAKAFIRNRKNFIKG